jgi:putative ABC transport system permease protein
MFSAIAVAALLIAAVGAYGVTSYSVSRRLHEMAVRLALGAQPRGLLAMVVRQGVTLAAVGIAVGLAGAIPMTLLMAKLLQGVGPSDPVAFGTVIAILLAVGVLPSYMPARRAAAVEPMAVLRND